MFQANRGYWLLLDAFIFIFTLCIIMKFGVANVEALNQQLICNEFDSKLQEHKQRMMVQVVGLLIPVLAFRMAYNHSKAQNMLKITLEGVIIVKGVKTMLDNHQNY